MGLVRCRNRKAPEVVEPCSQASRGTLCNGLRRACERDRYGTEPHIPNQETGAYDKGSLREEPYAAKVARTVLKQRRRGRPPRRLYQSASKSKQSTQQKSCMSGIGRRKMRLSEPDFHILWRAVEGKTPQVIAEQLGYTARWVRTVIGRWNAQGEAGIRDHRHEIDVSRPLLSSQQQEELAGALQAPPTDGGLWSGAIRGPVDAAAVRPSSRSTTRMGVSQATRSQQPCASTTACQSR
jgi:hypothetical protein